MPHIPKEDKEPVVDLAEILIVSANIVFPAEDPGEALLLTKGFIPMIKIRIGIVLKDDLIEFIVEGGIQCKGCKTIRTIEGSVTKRRLNVLPRR